MTTSQPVGLERWHIAILWCFSWEISNNDYQNFWSVMRHVVYLFAMHLKWVQCEDMIKNIESLTLAVWKCYHCDDLTAKEASFLIRQCPVSETSLTLAPRYDCIQLLTWYGFEVRQKWWKKKKPSFFNRAWATGESVANHWIRSQLFWDSRHEHVGSGNSNGRSHFCQQRRKDNPLNIHSIYSTFLCYYCRVLPHACRSTLEAALPLGNTRSTAPFFLRESERNDGISQISIYVVAIAWVQKPLVTVDVAAVGNKHCKWQKLAEWKKVKSKVDPHSPHASPR